jgi:hypothetical protein
MSSSTRSLTSLRRSPILELSSEVICRAVAHDPNDVASFPLQKGTK